MTLKERFIEWAEKRDKKQRENDTLLDRFRRNRKYHGHFEGYTEYPQMGSDGRVRIVREYTGAYYKASLSNAVYVVVRVVYILLFILAAVCQVSATLSDFGYNYVWYVTVFEALGFPLSFAMMVFVISAAISERNLKIRQYKRNHRFLPIAGFGGSAVHLIAAVCMVIFILTGNASSQAGIWWPPIKLFIASVCFFIISIVENKIDYEVLENTVKPKTGGIEIM